MIKYIEPTDFINKINNLDVNEFITFAKKYNIYQQSNSKFYDLVCNKIKERLDKEGLDYETVRPE